MSKLTVVYLKDTGNVLAALTRADPPATDEPVTALVGTALPVSAFGKATAGLTVSAQDLAAVTVDDQPDVVAGPQGFQVVADPQGALQVTSASPPGHVSLSVTVATGATVAVGTTPLPAMVVLQKVTTPSLPPTILSPVTVGPGTTPVFSKSLFATGETWNLYAFVQGMYPAAEQFLL